MRSQTSAPGIYAVGECAEHRGACCGLVEPAYEQAKALARHLAGLPARYEGSLSAASLKVSGVPVFSMGDFEGEGAETILLEDQEAAAYRKLVVRDGRLAGAVLFGDTADALWYRDLIRQQALDRRRSAPRSPSAGPTRRPPDERAGFHARSSAAIWKASSRACRRAAPRRA